MLAKLHSHLSYANVVSTLCLCMLLGGTAYAAVTITGKNVKNSSLTGTDIKNSSLTASDVKNRSLRAADFKAGQLPAGARGPAGSQGLKGDKGNPGSQGLEGDDGDPGPVTGVLPSGVSETGAFVARDPNNPGSKPLEATISFPLRLPAGVPASYVASGGPAVPQCTGSAANPTAPPGRLCVYQGVQANTGAGFADFIDPATTAATTTTTPFGVILRRHTVSAGDAYIYGSWAVTAP